MAVLGERGLASHVSFFHILVLEDKWYVSSLTNQQIQSTEET